MLEQLPHRAPVIEIVTSVLIREGNSRLPLINGNLPSGENVVDPDAASPPALETTQGNWLSVRAYDAKPSTSAFPWSLFSAQIAPFTLSNIRGHEIEHALSSDSPT
ncbi:MAG: hypothetical protein H7Z74_03030 [Anaerolineae bacterium]|nr:hypothetical protein [Gemmatimonadaceae bacterium]